MGLQCHKLQPPVRSVICSALSSSPTLLPLFPLPRILQLPASSLFSNYVPTATHLPTLIQYLPSLALPLLVSSRPACPQGVPNIARQAGFALLHRSIRTGLSIHSAAPFGGTRFSPLSAGDLQHTQGRFRISKPILPKTSVAYQQDGGRRSSQRWLGEP